MIFGRTLAFILGAAFGVALYDTQLERQAPLPQRQVQRLTIHDCSKEGAAGAALVSSMVSTWADTDPQIVCNYRR